MGQLHRPNRIEAAPPPREAGQTMAEYVVMLGVITIGIVLALGALTGATSTAVDRVTGFLGG